MTCNWRGPLVVFFILLSTSLAAACGGSTASPEQEAAPAQETVEASPDTAAVAPSETGADEARSDQSSLVVAMDPALLPYNFYGDGGEWTGINVDFANALADALGVELELEATTFDTIIPGLQSGRYDVALTGMFDTNERQEVLDFVDYLKAKSEFLVRADSDLAVQSFADLCGLTVGLNKGSFEVELVEAQQEECEAQGKDPIDGKVFNDLNATTLALKSGRVDVFPNDSATNAFLINENPGDFKTTGVYGDEGYFALGVLKGSPLLDQFHDAFEELVQNGTYMEILEKWGIADRAMEEITINQAAF